MKVIVTGGAGFIGSCIVKTLNDIGIFDIVIVDNIHASDKWKNIRNKVYTEYIHKHEFLDNLHEYKNYSHIIHMGACSNTFETNFDYLYKNNFYYTKRLWEFSIHNNISFIYASSAATYGGGEGFDDKTDLKGLLPLNAYGYSKHLFDLWVEKQKKFPKQYVGLKFFNVYGPNEYCKNQMASMVYQGYRQIVETGTINLYKSYNMMYQHGEQKRDFIYVKDVCKVIVFFLTHPNINGLYNVGTGKAESFNVLAESIFSALQLEKNITYIEMPDKMRNKYQYFTQANVKKLFEAGFNQKFFSLAEGIQDYIVNFLKNKFLNY